MSDYQLRFNQNFNFLFYRPKSIVGIFRKSQKVSRPHLYTGRL
jgi:hypothetical protein